MKRIFLFFLFACFLFACDEEPISNVPYAPVSLSLNLNLEDNVLNGALSYKMFKRNQSERTATDRLGYGGLLIVNGGGGPTTSLLAFDLACPVEAKSEILIVPNNTGQATCSKCGAVYNIISDGGWPVSGSKFRLRQYRVFPDNTGNNRFRVTN